MFHCNGWTYPWAVTAVAGTHVCLRRVEPAAIFAAIAEHRVTHLCGAPIVLNMLVHAPEAVKRRFDHVVEAATGGAAPPSAVIEAMERMGFRVTHLYGLTESYGPSTVCAWQEEWDGLPLGRARREDGAARGGEPDPRRPARGRSGDDGRRAGRRRHDRRAGAAQQHADEGLSEEPGGHRRRRSPAAGSTPATSRSCIRTAMSRSRTAPRTSSSRAARTSPRSRSRRCSTAIRRSWRRRWSPGPTRNGARRPCAFVTLKPGCGAGRGRRTSSPGAATTSRISRRRSSVVFGPLPKTSTGKIQKYELRERAKEIVS